MKPAVLFSAMVLFLSAPTLAKSQFYFSAGPSVSFGSYHGLNYVIDRYNQTRQGQAGAATLTREMNNLKILGSAGWRVGGHFPVVRSVGWYFGVSRTGRRAHTWAKGTDVNGAAVRRDLLFTANSVNIEGGLGFGGPDEGGMVVFGMSSDFLKHRVYTKLTGEDYKRVFDELSVGLSMFADINIFLTDAVALTVRPAYQFSPTRMDYYALNKTLNPATYTNDYTESMISGAGNITLHCMVSVVLGN